MAGLGEYNLEASGTTILSLSLMCATICAGTSVVVSENAALTAPAGTVTSRARHHRRRQRMTGGSAGVTPMSPSLCLSTRSGPNRLTANPAS
jgi:hypothetical protein